MSKAKYKVITGREQKRDADVLCYQIRQSFQPGELNPEAALEIGYELAMRWTKGNHAFFVVSHADRPHPHVHIYYNSTALDCSRKFRNFLGSTFALRRLSDRVCLEHDLSVIQNPKLHSKGKFLHYGQWLGADRRPSQKEQLRAAIDTALAQRPADLPALLSLLESAGVQVVHVRGGVLSFKLPGYERPARWRSSTLGSGYGPEDVQAVIDGKAPARPAPVSGPALRQRINFVIDIQQRMAQGKGPGYEHWAKLYNLKQMAAALQFLQENGLTDYDTLAEKTETAVDRAHALAGKLRAVEDQLA
ncbi:MAG: relaxase/mobilization nuclease domain-containing protein, partial [Desulfovibrionaceae bacterium]|nr:relaxase/mobilization nuclease domain-containing protein [Desulfovibrionaceae bacterium]